MKTKNLKNLKLSKVKITNLNEIEAKGGRHDYTYLTYCDTCTCKTKFCNEL